MYSSNARATAHNYDVMLNGSSQGEEVMFKTMSDVRAKNKEIGHFFFDRETMKFWDSKVETGLFRGRYFITSERERTATAKRKFKVREVLKTGEIISVGIQYPDLDSAKEAVKALIKSTPKATKKAS